MTEAFDVDQFRTEISRAAQVLQDSLPGSLVTLIIRFPTHPDAYVVAGLDNLDALEDVIQRARSVPAQ